MATIRLIGAQHQRVFADNLFAAHYYFQAASKIADLYRRGI
jgi:hypothetical protein